MRILRKLSSVSVAAATLVGALATTALAADTTTWSNEFTPSNVYAGYDDNAVYISGVTYPENWKSGTVTVKPACTNPGLIKIKLDSSNVMSLGLAAMLSGKKVSCVVTEVCEGSYPVAKQCKIIR